MREINDTEISQYGIYTKHHMMDNGERRFRLFGADGSSYTRTESVSDSGWQKSHYHSEIKELYLVQKGWILFAEFVEDEVKIRKYVADEYCISHTMVPHNVYLAPDTVIHTIKFGDCSKADWNGCEELDEMIQKIEDSNET